MERHTLDIRSRLSAARLPAIPQVLLQLVAQCESDGAGMAALARILASDAALSAKVLRVATTPVYHRGPHPANLERALTTIGIDMVRTLLITESIYQTFNQLGSTFGFDLRLFWRHAVATAITARFVARQAGYGQLEEAYLAGLLHDIGRLALAAAAPEEYEVNFQADDDLGLCAREERTLEITHAEAGAWLLEKLNLDSFIADSVRYHHDPLPRLRNAHPLVRVTAVADLLVGAAEAGCEAPAQIQELIPISGEELRAHNASLDTEVQALAKLLGLDLGGAVREAPGDRQRASAQRPARNDPLVEKMRDLILVSKATEGLARQRGADACYRAIVGAAIILFDFADAIIFAAAPSGNALMPVALPEGRQRLAGLCLPLDGNGLAALACGEDGVAFHLPSSRPPSVAEEQLLRLLATDSLIALRLGKQAEDPRILLGAINAAQAHHLQDRLQLLRDFGAQAGAAVDGAVRRESAEMAANNALVSEFQLASKRVAHEVNNPLTIIKNYLGVLNRKTGGDQTIGQDLAVLSEEIDRVAQIVNEFASSQQGLSQEECHPDSVLDYACRLFLESQSVNPAVRIKCIPAKSDARVGISSSRMSQILLNLIKNANEAMPGGGEIELRNAGVVRRDGRDFVAISVSDNGPGIPGDILNQLFSAARSTKGGPHRGLGLSIVHELITGAGGRISCRSDRSGTAFDILLPAIPADSMVAQPAS